MSRVITAVLSYGHDFLYNPRFNWSQSKKKKPKNILLYHTQNKWYDLFQKIANFFHSVYFSNPLNIQVTSKAFSEEWDFHLHEEWLKQHGYIL